MLIVLSIFLVLLLEPLLADKHKYKEHKWDCTAKCAKCSWKSTSTVDSCTPVDCTQENSPLTAVSCDVISGGDPHFIMWNDQHFSFHGECDLLIYSNQKFASGAGLMIQIRTEIKNYFSYIKNIAIQVGDQFFEIEANSGHTNFYLNRKVHEEPITTFAGYQVRKVKDAPWCKDKCSFAKILNFDFEELGTMDVGQWGTFLHLRLGVAPSYQDTFGLLAKLGEAGFFARNDTVLQSADLYGKEWQVLDTEPMLFHETRQPQYPEQCIMPKPIARRFIDGETRRMAQRVCSHLSGPRLDMCIFDVEATGDENMAISPLY